MNIQHYNTQHNGRALLCCVSVMLNVTYVEYHYAECHYAECHYAECRYAECHYAECRYTECHYTECRGAEMNTKFFPAESRDKAKLNISICDIKH